MKIRQTLVASAILLASLGASVAYASPVIIDGNFNDPLAAGNFQTFNVGASFGGADGKAWQVIGSTTGNQTTGYGSSGVDEIGTYWGPPATGGGSVDLDGNAPGGISQTIATAAGERYDLLFYLSGNPDGAPLTKTLSVNAGGPAQTYTYTLPPGANESNTTYLPEEFSFLASGTSTTISFQSADIGSPFGPVIGGVSITDVPEPASWAVLLFGLFGIGFMARGARRKTAAVTA